VLIVNHCWQVTGIKNYLQILMKLYKGITVFNAWLKNERVAVAVCQWISLALCMATSRSYAKSANYHFCDLIEM